MKKYTQTGTFSMLVMIPCIIFLIVLLYITGSEETIMIAVLSFCALIFIMALLVFCRLTIIIDNTHLTFIMGIGLIRKSFLLSDIESCTPVRNSVLWGIGIHMTPHGWLYNVSGLSAIEISFKNSKSKIRIGTDRPEEIAEEVNSRIDSKVAGSYYEKSGKQGIYLTIAVLVFFIGIIVLIFVSGSREIKITFSNSSMTISGMYGLSVNYSGITEADTLQTLPGIKTRTNGYAAGGILKGHFKLLDNSKVMLFIREKRPPYILLKTSNTPIYLNSGNSAQTREYFRNIQEKINKSR
jgi:hypothetical protein